MWPPALLIQARVDAGLSVRELAHVTAERRGRSAESIRTTIHRYEADGGPVPRIQTVMVPENLLHPVPENLLLRSEGSMQDDLGIDHGDDDRGDAEQELEGMR